MDKKRELTSFGIMVKKALVEKQKTQVWLAKQVGTTNQYLNLIFHGERSGDKYKEEIIRVLCLDQDMLEKIA